MLPTKIQVNWPFGLGVEAKNGFLRLRHGGHLGFLIGTIYLFLIYKSPQCFVPSFKSISLSIQKKKRKIDFQDGGQGGHLGFPIGTILNIFYLQVTLMLHTKFKVNWPFGLGDEPKNRVSRWLPWRPSLISDRNDFSYF